MALQTGRTVVTPPTFALTSDGVLLIADGINGPKRWDGLTSAVETAGIPAASAPTVTTASGGAATYGDYVCAIRYIDDDGQPGNLSPLTTLTGVTANYKFSWTTIPTSSDTRVANIELYRSTSGETDVLYLVTTVANSGTPTYSTDTSSDTTLSANTALRVLNQDGSINARRFTVPPNDQASVNLYQDRTYWAANRVYSEGNVKVTNGSASVTGVGTAFTSAMIGRYLYVDGATVPYTISAVGSATALTLSSNYGGTTNKFAMYGIRPKPNHRNLIQYSSLGEPEAVYLDDTASPIIGYGILMQEDNDEIVGSFSHHGYEYVFKRRHVYRVSCDNCDPSNSGGLFLVANRGAVSIRAMAAVGDALYVMDYEGIYILDSSGVRGNGDGSNISDPISDLWRSGINFGQAKWFHAAHDPTRTSVHFFVCLDGSRYPRHVLSFNYRTQSWAIEEYWQMMPAAAQGVVNGPMTMFMGGEHNKVWRKNYAGRTLDAPSTGTVRGTATSSTWQSLTDSSAAFNSDIVGSHVVIVSGRGKWQVRRIVSVTSTALRIRGQWSTQPDTTSVYQIGGVSWRWRGGIHRFAAFDRESGRTLRLHYEPTATAGSLDMRTYLNHAASPADCSLDNSRDDATVTTTADDPDVVVDLKRTRPSGAEATGFAMYAFDDGMERDAQVDRWVSPELRGVQASDPVRLYGLIVEGVGQ